MRKASRKGKAAASELAEVRAKARAWIPDLGRTQSGPGSPAVTLLSYIAKNKADILRAKYGE